ncbi:ankyrin repeat domain-containing protein [Dactylosporangium vinaceum]|uniref:ankyrin repeat domain-containing protein n=1 Tax=Dactylosporangium vinaceum TaxID=53362 RepID=UPI001CA9F17C|nr:ankyrin repeat domain-containing protein [Dactylosporangium vinaceum]UAB96938.1 ankyrin repeat domain-containing protein [Dactylosporangium vinaceum]
MRPLHPSAVPMSMIEQANERRLAGDWGGACRAAGITVDIQTEYIRRQYGTEVLDHVMDTMRHLVPDLLRWYIRRDRNGLPLKNVWYPLALFPDGHALGVHPARWAQRIDIRFERIIEQPGLADESFLHLRYRWDDRRTGDIRALCGIDDPRTDRLLKLEEEGRHAAAWAAAGYDMHVLLFDRRFGRERIDPAAFSIDPDVRNHARGVAVERSLAWLRPIHTALAAAARHTLAHARELRDTETWPRPGHAPSNPRPDVDDHLGLTRIDVKGRSIVLDGSRARLVSRVPYNETDQARRLLEIDEFGATLERIARIPMVLARRPEELQAEQLHPLVHRVLSTAPPVPPKAAELRTTIRVRCDSATHEVAMRNGAFVVPHTQAEIDRELALAALGGQVQGCVAAREGWRDPDVRMPRPMRRLQFDLMRLVLHGDTAAIVRALDRGLDPHVRDMWGRTLLHLLPQLPGSERLLLPRLLAAGLDPNARDDAGRTPLHEAVAEGPEQMVRILLKAGADPKAQTKRGGYTSMAGFTGRPELHDIRGLL